MTDNQTFTILIIEDDPALRRMYEMAFSLKKYTVATADDGTQGLARSQELNPTIILLDIMMPELNGFEVLKKIKADPKISHIPVIILSNLTGEEYENSALEAGATKYIVKSDHDPHEVVDIVHDLIQTT